MQGSMHTNQCIKPSRHVIQYDAKTFRQVLQLPRGRRLENVKPSKKYKAQEERFPRHWNANEGDELTGNFVDDDKLRIFDVCDPRDASACRNSYDDYDDRERKCEPDL